MILRFIWLSVIFLLLNVKTFADTVVVVGNDQNGRVHFYAASDKYSSAAAAEKAKSKCMNMGMALCVFLYRLSGTANARECLAIVVRPSPTPVRDGIHLAVARDGSVAISNAEAQCDASGPMCILSELVCDPRSADDFSATPDNSATKDLLGLFDGRTVAAIIDHIRDELEVREALVFYSVAFGFMLFVVLSLYDVISNDRRSIRRMAVNFVLSCVVIIGIIITGLVTPAVWGWILSLSTPAIVLLGAVTCGLTLLFIPVKFWRSLKERNAFERGPLPEPPEVASSRESTGVLNKKAIR
jgi:hypothetical protein